MGTACLGCTFAVGILEQFASSHEQKVEEALEFLCGILPKEFRQTCDNLVEQYGPFIIPLLANGATADEVCQTIDVCQDKTCHLYPLSGKDPRRFEPLVSSIKKERGALLENPIDWLIKVMENVFDNHLPLVDVDGDTFTFIKEFRGSSWKGQDCNDFESNIYPGRLKNGFGSHVDHDCNGIFGVNPNTGNSYEDELCAGTNPYGVIVIGDSAVAHFHFPPEWVNATAINNETYIDALQILTNEIDFPQMSAGTGFETSKWHGAPQGPLDSIYLRVRGQNLCSHRDYQNIGVNGAKAKDIPFNNGLTMKRNQTIDKPALVTVALLGNDVCKNGYPAGMTSVNEFYESSLNTLKMLDKQLPAGSFVTLMGLVDGRVLFNAMHNRIHPLGALRGDVTYESFYSFMECTGASPCPGWMTSNDTRRNETSERAAELSEALKKAAETYQPKNFQTVYMDCPMIPVIGHFVGQGGKVWELIEPFDGFHPSQLANYLLVEYQWQYMIKNYPNMVPPANPNNSKIKQIFGNQGGY